MDSIKTAVVVTILLVVSYAVYQAIHNSTGSNPPPEAADNFPSSVDVKIPGEEKGSGKGGASPWSKPGGSRAATSGRSGRDGPPLWDDSGKSTPVADRPDVPRRSRLAGGDDPAGIAGIAAKELDRPPTRSGAADPKTPGGDEVRQPPQQGRQGFREMMDEARRRVEEGNERLWADVLLQLSKVYGNVALSAEESQELVDLLGQLAGTVIYSRRHVLEPPYVVQPGESLRQIAQRHNVPWQLLAKINGIRDPDQLPAGRQIKVLRGPFDAEVHLDRYELVLLLGEYYAGRFPIGIGRDQPRLEGSYVVKDKATRRPYYGPDGIIDAADPNNPLGKLWIGLTEHIGIHGTSDPKNLRRADNRGTICLGERDIEDLFDILSAESELAAGSRVTIRR